MAIHDDNWTKEFKRTDEMRMTWKERLVFISVGFLPIAMFLSPYLPAVVWTVLQPLIIGTVITVAALASGYFIYKGITGRW